MDAVITFIALCLLASQNHLSILMQWKLTHVLYCYTAFLGKDAYRWHLLNKPSGAYAPKGPIIVIWDPAAATGTYPYFQLGMLWKPSVLLTICENYTGNYSMWVAGSWSLWLCVICVHFACMGTWPKCENKILGLYRCGSYRHNSHCL